MVKLAEKERDGLEVHSAYKVLRTSSNGLNLCAYSWNRMLRMRQKPIC